MLYNANTLEKSSSCSITDNKQYSYERYQLRQKYLATTFGIFYDKLHFLRIDNMLKSLTRQKIK